jgi:cysteine desulfurase
VARVYLDYNATAPLRAEALAALTGMLAQPGNPSSVHGEGRNARRRVEAARREVASLIAAAPGELVFTSGGTEANNLAIFGSRPRTVIASAVEHDAVLQAAHASGATVRLVRVGADGALDMAHLADLLAAAEAPVLVSVMLANNETGVIFPVAGVAALAHRHGALVHCDAVQAAGKIPVDVKALGVDLLTLSAHKLGGPQGVGALWVAPQLDIDPVQRGGGQERGLRAGTENVAGIVAFGAAAAAARDGGAGDRLAVLRAGLEAGVRAAQPLAVIYGEAQPRLPNTACIGLPGVAAETQVMALDLAGVAVSAGAACSSGKLRPSHVLVAMGHGEAAARCAIRVSLGWNSTAADVERFLAAWTPLARKAAA